jgi:hypothetical protein
MADEVSNPIIDFLDEKKIAYQIKEGGCWNHRIINFSYTGVNADIECLVHYSENLSDYTIFGMTGNNIPKGKSQEVMKVANFANLKSLYTTMIINEETNIFWTRCTITSKDVISTDIFNRMVNNVCLMYDDFIPLIMKVIYADNTGEEVISNYLQSLKKDESETSSPKSVSFTGYE